MSTPHYLDLTHRLRIGTLGYPGCARLVGWPLREEVRGDYNMLHISTDLHTGTHLDAMRHCLPGGADVTALPLEHCAGPALIVDLTAKGLKGATFTPEDFLPYEQRLRALGKLLVKTGWSSHWESPAYHDHFPGFSREAASYLADLGLHLVGLEQPSVHPVDHLEVHRIFFRREIIIVEGLDNLAAVPVDEVEFFAAPIPLETADGSLVRAFCCY